MIIIKGEISPINIQRSELAYYGDFFKGLSETQCGYIDNNVTLNGIELALLTILTTPRDILLEKLDMLKMYDPNNSFELVNGSIKLNNYFSDIKSSFSAKIEAEYCNTEQGIRQLELCLQEAKIDDKNYKFSKFFTNFPYAVKCFFSEKIYEVYRGIEYNIKANDLNFMQNVYCTYNAFLSCTCLNDQEYDNVLELLETLPINKILYHYYVDYFPCDYTYSHYLKFLNNDAIICTNSVGKCIDCVDSIFIDAAMIDSFKKEDCLHIIDQNTKIFIQRKDKIYPLVSFESIKLIDDEYQEFLTLPYYGIDKWLYLDNESIFNYSYSDHKIFTQNFFDFLINSYIDVHKNLDDIYDILVKNIDKYSEATLRTIILNSKFSR